MVRNLSFKADDDFDDKLYSVSKKKGMTKSAFIKQEIGKLISDEKLSNKENSELNSSLSSEEMKNKNNPVWLAFNKPEEKLEQKMEVKLDNNPEVKREEKVPELINPGSKPEIKVPEVKININPEIKKEQNILKKVNKMSDEGKIDERVIDERINKLLNRKEFDGKLQDIHTKVNQVNERVCKDGECFKNDLTELKKVVSILSKSENLDEIKREISELKKTIPEVELCPTCGVKSVPHLSSFCPNCGVEIKEWTDSNGKKVEGWKPYKLRK